jgi:hypothetical protein
MGRKAGDESSTNKLLLDTMDRLAMRRRRVSEMADIIVRASRHGRRLSVEELRVLQLLSGWEEKQSSTRGGPPNQESEHTQWARVPVVAALKVLFPPDGLKPKGRSVKWVTDKLNALSEFKDNPVSPDTVDRALKDIKAALEK